LRLRRLDRLGADVAFEFVELRRKVGSLPQLGAICFFAAVFSLVTLIQAREFATLAPCIGGFWASRASLSRVRVPTAMSCRLSGPAERGDLPREVPSPAGELSLAALAR